MASCRAKTSIGSRVLAVLRGKMQNRKMLAEDQHFQCSRIAAEKFAK